MAKGGVCLNYPDRFIDLETGETCHASCERNALVVFYESEGGMTLDEAICHAREVSEKNYEVGVLWHANPDDEELDVYCECAKDHLQLAEWLEDYKRLKSLEEEVYEKTKSCENCKYDDRGEDEQPCVECCERYMLKFEPELKPCPFCGGKAKVRSEDRKKGKAYWAHCAEPIETGCDVRPVTCRFDTPEEAAEAWNRRADK